MKLLLIIALVLAFLAALSFGVAVWLLVFRRNKRNHEPPPPPCE